MHSTLISRRAPRGKRGREPLSSWGGRGAWALIHIRSSWHLPRFEGVGRGRARQGLWGEFIALDEGHTEPESPEAHISTAGAVRPPKNPPLCGHDPGRRHWWPSEGSIGSAQERQSREVILIPRLTTGDEKTLSTAACKSR